VISCCGITAIGGRDGSNAVELDRSGDGDEEQEVIGSSGVVLCDLGTGGSVDRFRTWRKKIKK
jgi:hypothetical protein